MGTPKQGTPTIQEVHNRNIPTWILMLLVYSYYIRGVPCFGVPETGLASIIWVGAFPSAQVVKSTTKEHPLPDYGMAWHLCCLVKGQRRSRSWWVRHLRVFGYAGMAHGMLCG